MADISSERFRSTGETAVAHGVVGVEEFRGVEVDGVAEIPDADGVVDGADFLFAAGTDPAPADELVVVFILVVVGSRGDAGVAAHIFEDGGADYGLLEI